MSQQDDAFVKVFVGVFGGLVVFTIAIIILANSVGDLEQEAVYPEAKGANAVLDRIAPVGQVRLAGEEPEEAAPAGPRTGKEVVDAACAACHATGAAGAPKLGDEGAWADRLSKGFDTLLDHAINGFKGMPARGGNPNLSDAEMHNAVAHMVQGVGGDAPAEKTPAPAPEAGAGEGETAAAGEAATGEAPAAPEPVSAEAVAQGEPQAAQAGGADLAQGRQVYQNACFACHGTGVAGAPRIDDKAAWAPRLEQGRETLVNHAINGIRGMPPKGGRMDLSDKAVTNAVVYMMEQVK